jgi:hypothetical protein
MMNNNSFIPALADLLGLAPESDNPAAAHAALAGAVVNSYLQGNVSNFPAVFETIEKQVIYGDEEEQRLVIVEFLENIKNYSVLNDLDYAVFEEWIGPETHQAWRWLEKHWQGKRSLASAAEGTSGRLYLPGNRKRED